MFRFIALTTVLFTLLSCNRLLEGNANLKAEKFNRKALDFQAIGAFDSAIVNYQKALSFTHLKGEAKAIVIRNLGNAYLDNDQIDSAKACYMRAVNLSDEGSYLKLVCQADVDVLNGNLGRAVKQLEQALEMPEADVAAFNLMGLIYLGAYDTTYYNISKAIDYNRRAMQVDYSNTTIWLLMRSYYENGEYENAYRLAGTLYERNPEIEDYVYAMAILAYETDNLEQASRMANQLITADSSYYPDLYYMLEEPAI